MEFATGDVFGRRAYRVFVQIGIHAIDTMQLIDMILLGAEFSVQLLCLMAQFAVRACIRIGPRHSTSGNEEEDEDASAHPHHRPMPAHRPMPLLELHDTKIDDERHCRQEMDIELAAET